MIRQRLEDMLVPHRSKARNMMSSVEPPTRNNMEILEEALSQVLALNHSTTVIKNTNFEQDTPSVFINDKSTEAMTTQKILANI